MSFARPAFMLFTLIAAIILPLSAHAAAKAERFSMLQSVESAMAYNPDLKATQEDNIHSQLAVDKAKAGFLPKVYAQAGVGAGWRSDSTNRYYKDDGSFRAIGEASAKLTQPLWHGWAIKGEHDMRKEQLASSDNMLQDKGINLAFEAISAHTDVLRRREMVDLAKKNVKEHEKILRTVRERYDTNVSTVGELHQITGRVARSQATLAAYQSALDSARANYLRVTGKNPPELGTPPKINLPYPTLEALLEACRANNPRLKAAQHDITATQHGKQVAQSRFYPRFDAEIGPYWNNRDGKGPSNKVEAMEGMLMVRWDIFDGGADVAAVSQAKARTRQARHTAEFIDTMLSEDVEATYSRYLSANEQIRQYERAKKSARLSREDFYRQFLAAQRTLLDVLDAENDYFYAASQQSMCEGDRIIAGYRLLALAGDLLNRIGINSTKLKQEKPSFTWEF